MMKKLWKISVMMIVCGIILSGNIVNVFAEKELDEFGRDIISSNYQESGYDLVAPVANDVCSGLAYHDLRARGWGTVYKGDDYYIKSGACWQCVNCYTVVITEGDIWYNQMQTIGKYAICPWPEPITYTGCVMMDASYYGKTSNNYLSGYHFGIE